MRWIVTLPRFLPQSNGIRFMHRMVDMLVSLGRDARIAFINENSVWSQTVEPGAPGAVNPEWKAPLCHGPGDVPGSIVVYPEIIHENPLGAEKVVRYFGNRDGYLTGKKVSIGPSDYVVAHSRVIRRDAGNVLYYPEINPCFHADGTEPLSRRTVECTYDGKGVLYGPVYPIPGTIAIRRNWPPSQVELAELLRRTRVLHTWDPWTSTNVEAILCGAALKVYRYEPWTPWDLDECEIGPIPIIDRGRELPTDEEFERQRAEMLERIVGLQASWPERFRQFVEDVERHFGG